MPEHPFGEFIRDPWWQQFQQAWIEAIQSHPNAPEVIRVLRENPALAGQLFAEMPGHGSSDFPFLGEPWANLRKTAELVPGYFAENPSIRPEVTDVANEIGPANRARFGVSDLVPLSPQELAGSIPLGRMDPGALARNFASRVNAGVMGPWDFYPGGIQQWLADTATQTGVPTGGLGPWETRGNPFTEFF